MAVRTCVSAITTRNTFEEYWSVSTSNRVIMSHLWFVRGIKPIQAKKSLRRAFSSMPTRPVAGDALKRYLVQSVTRRT